MSGMMLATVVVQALGWCLVHFVWQAAVVGVAYAGLRLLLPRGNARYLAAMAMLVLLAALPAWTFWREWHSLLQPLVVGGAVAASTDGVVAAVAAPASGWLAPLRLGLPWLVLAWAIGVAVLGGRVIRQWRRLRALVRAAESLPVWQERARELGSRLGLWRAVRVLASVRIATPTLVGWVRPVVVLPLAMLARMPAEQVDLVLAHELAHLRRLDHWANLFQVVLETLLFYHPVVHWISRDARNERELCCDALALRASGGRRRDFVAALAGLEAFRSDHAELALAAGGGVLVDRAWFIAGAPPRRPRVRLPVGVLAFVLVATCAGGAAAWWHAASERALAAAVARNAAAISVRLPKPMLDLQLPHAIQFAPLRLAGARAEPTASPLPEKATVIAPSVAPPALQLDLPRRALATSVPDLVLAPQPAAAAANPAPVADAMPQALRVVAPVYPREALANGVAGRVVVAFSLDAGGHPRDLEVVSASPSGVFDGAALAALAEWRFRGSATAGQRYRQAFSFAPDDAARGARVIPARASCYQPTGTHICRHVGSDLPGPVQLARPGR